MAPAGLLPEAARMIAFTKAHAYGNDFLYVPAGALAGADLAAWARRLCDRHRGVGADGLILYTVSHDGATMTLLNADGSPSELSGNGLRGLAAIIARERAAAGDTAAEIRVETTAGLRTLTLDAVRASQYLFTARMGHPSEIRQSTLDVDGERVLATVLSVGNPQCVVLGALPDDQRFARLGAALERHPAFPNRTNVEFAYVESPERIRIRIWERGVGPTESSGTGSCAAAVTAMHAELVDREVDVEAPGGTQHVAWTDRGVFLTGWAEVVVEGHWIADADAPGSLRGR
jgi:diaminopimelate epimerase